MRVTIARGTIQAKEGNMKLGQKIAAAGLIAGLGLFSPWINARRREKPSVAPSRTELLIVNCHDGDTCTARHREGWTLKLRLIGIDAPEVAGRKTHGKAKPGQVYGNEATRYLNDLVAGKKLPIDILGNDIYHRYLAVIWSQDGKSRINEQMVRQGYAYAYRGKFAGKESRTWAEEAEKLAHKEKLGLWALPEQERPQDPTLYRRKNP